MGTTTTVTPLYSQEMVEDAAAIVFRYVDVVHVTDISQRAQNIREIHHSEVAIGIIVG